MKTTLKKGILAVSLVLVAFLSYLFFFKKASLELVFFPENSQLKIDGEEVVSDRETALKLKPGVHTISISTEGYVPWEKSLKLSSLKRNRLEVRLKKIPSPIQVLNTEIADFKIEEDKLYYLDLKKKIIQRIHIKGEQDLQLPQEVTLVPIPEAKSFELKERILLIQLEGKYLIYDTKKPQLKREDLKEFQEGVTLVRLSHKKEKIAAVVQTESGRKEILILDAGFRIERRLDVRTLNFPLKIAWLHDDSALLIIDNLGKLYLGEPFSQELIPLPLKNDLKALDLLTSIKTSLTVIEVMGERGIEIQVLDSKTKAFLPYSQATSLNKVAFLENESLLVSLQDSREEKIIIWQPRENLVKQLYYNNPLGLSVIKPLYVEDQRSIFFLSENKNLYKLLLEDGKY